MKETTVTHIRCECGHDNELVSMFELEQDCGEEIKCAVCGLHYKRELLVPLVKNVLDRLFKDKDNFKKHCKDDKLYESEMKRYKKLYDTL